MKKYELKEIENILQISGHSYPLNKEAIEEYFNYFVDTLNIANPDNFFAQKCCLGLCHGLYILMYGRDLKDILDNFQGTEKDKKNLLNKISVMNKDFLLEISILGQLSRNGSNINFYDHLDGKNPEASIEINGKKYLLEVTRTEVTNSKGENLIEKRGMVWMDMLVERIQKEKERDYLNGKTFIFSPTTSFPEFWSKLEEFNGSLSEFFVNSDEVDIVDEILNGDESAGVSYELKGDEYFCKFVIKSTFNHFYNKLSKKSKRQYKDSKTNFILYVEIANMNFMGIGEIVSELQHYLRKFSNCAAVIICERFAIDYQEKYPDLFSECYFVANGNCKDVIDPRTPDGEYDFSDIDKLILCKNTHFIVTKNGNASLISKREFANRYN